VKALHATTQEELQIIRNFLEQNQKRLKRIENFPAYSEGLFVRLDVGVPRLKLMKVI
jgi:hypothetical protein